MAVRTKLLITLTLFSRQSFKSDEVKCLVYRARLILQLILIYCYRVNLHLVLPEIVKHRPSYHDQNTYLCSLTIHVASGNGTDPTITIRTLTFVPWQYMLLHAMWHGPNYHDQNTYLCSLTIHVASRNGTDPTIMIRTLTYLCYLTIHVASRNGTDPSITIRTLIFVPWQYMLLHAMAQLQQHIQYCIV